MRWLLLLIKHVTLVTRGVTGGVTGSVTGGVAGGLVGVIALTVRGRTHIHAGENRGRAGGVAVMASVMTSPRPGAK